MADPDRGQDQPILVRPFGDRYQVVDGDHRLTAADELGWETIEAHSEEMTDFEALCRQLTNVLRVETKTEDIRRHLLRIQKLKPDMKIGDMVRATGKSRSWVRKQLTLDNLIPEAAHLLESGQLKTSNAYELATVRSAPRQRQLLPHACLLTLREFTQMAAKHRREMMLAAKDRSAEERLAGLKKKAPRTRQQAMNILRHNHEAASLICKHLPESRLEAFLLGVKWAWHLENKNENQSD